MTRARVFYFVLLFLFLQTFQLSSLLFIGVVTVEYDRQVENLIQNNLPKRLLDTTKMDQDIESLRVEFLRILGEIEKIAKGNNDRPYEPSAYESCIKIDGKSILPPVMTAEKKELCSKWKKEAIQVEEKLAKKHKATIVQAVQDRFALTEQIETDAKQSKYLHTCTDSN